MPQLIQELTVLPWVFIGLPVSGNLKLLSFWTPVPGRQLAHNFFYQKLSQWLFFLSYISLTNTLFQFGWDQVGRFQVPQDVPWRRHRGSDSGLEWLRGWAGLHRAGVQLFVRPMAPYWLKPWLKRLWILGSIFGTKKPCQWPRPVLPPLTDAHCHSFGTLAVVQAQLWLIRTCSVSCGSMIKEILS